MRSVFTWCIQRMRSEWKELLCWLHQLCLRELEFLMRMWFKSSFSQFSNQCTSTGTTQRIELFHWQLLNLFSLSLLHSSLILVKKLYWTHVTRFKKESFSWFWNLKEIRSKIVPSVKETENIVQSHSQIYIVISHKTSSKTVSKL